MLFKLLKSIVLVVVICTISIPEYAQARQNYFQPITAFEWSYDDNIALNLDAVSQRRARLILGLEYVSAESETNRFSAEIRAHVDRYSDTTLDTENFFANLGYFKSTPRRDFDLGFRLRRETVLTGQFQDTGIVGQNPTQERLDGTADVRWAERFSLRWTGELAVSYQRTEFPGAEDSRGFIEFDNWFPNGILSYSLSERTAIFGQFGSNFYNPLNTSTDQEQRSDRLLLGFRGSLSERLEYRAAAGWENFDFENLGGVERQEQDTDGGAWDIYGRWKAELSAWTLGTSRLGRGSSRGTLTRQTRAYVAYDRDLTSILRFFLSGELGRREFPSDPDRVGIDRDYTEFTTGFRWAFAQKWRFQARYRYRRQEFNVRGEDARSTNPDSNAVFLTLDYDFDRL